jgi:hypothetical protein
MTTAEHPARPPSIFSPVVDFLCVGGLSLVILVPLLLSGDRELAFLSLGALVWAQLLVNLSHFMASYRIVYRDRETILRHKWASIGVPLILLAFAAGALIEAQEPPILLMAFFVVSSAYLAWHYTGQVWGMMASHGYLGGIRFEPVERLLVRGSLRLLLVWHVAWFLDFWLSRTTSPLAGPASDFLAVATVGAFAAILVGALGLTRLTRRTGRLPPVNVLVPWLAIFFWYAAISRWGLKGLFLVQLFHAVQYLEFPARVELNRAAVRAGTAARTAAHMAWYAFGLVLVSLLVSFAVPGPPMSLIAARLGVDVGTVAPILLFYLINIHHYFTDGVAWKLSNPAVRQDLFAHVRPPAVAAGKDAGKPQKARQGKVRK